MNKNNHKIEQYKEAIGSAHKQFTVTGSLKDELNLYKIISESWQFVSKTDESMHYWAGFTSVFTPKH